MAKYRKKPIIVDATRWFKNGDHPDDDVIIIPRPENYEDLPTEGKVVRYFRHPDVSGSIKCEQCNQIVHDHGWIDGLGTNKLGHIVCPGDFIITDSEGKYYPCKPDIFAETYELVEDEKIKEKYTLHGRKIHNIEETKKLDFPFPSNEGL